MLKFRAELVMVNENVYLLPRPLDPCPADRPLAIGTKLRWHKQTNERAKCQTKHRNGEANKNRCMTESKQQ